MTAGFVAVPTIVPLKVCTAGRRKNHVDTDTKIELKSGAPFVRLLVTMVTVHMGLVSCTHTDTEGAVVYYTVNGRRPTPFERKTSHTLQYHTPFTLATGKVS